MICEALVDATSGAPDAATSDSPCLFNFIIIIKVFDKFFTQMFHSRL